MVATPVKEFEIDLDLGPCDTLETLETLVDRVTLRPDVFGGKPIIRDMRISVESLLAQMALGASTSEMLDEYPFLEPDDLRACLAFASLSLAGSLPSRFRGKR